MKTVGYILKNVLKYGLKGAGLLLRAILMLFLIVMRLTLSVIKLADQQNKEIYMNRARDEPIHLLSVNHICFNQSGQDADTAYPSNGRVGIDEEKNKTSGSFTFNCSVAVRKYFRSDTGTGSFNQNH